MPVRTGALRGRSLTWWKDLSPVAHRSKNGHRAAPVKKRPIISRPGMSTDSDTVCPRKLISQAGIMQAALQNAHVEVGLRRRGDRQRGVRTVQPDRVDLRERREHHQRAEDEEEPRLALEQEVREE